MSLYEILNEISQKQILKDEWGDTRIYGAVVGVVTQNTDQRSPVQSRGRVCVRLPMRGEEGSGLQWARVAMPSSGKSWGHYFLPEVGDQVLVVFEGGCIEKPYIIGCIPRDNSCLISQNANRGNTKKTIVSTAGSRLAFDDTKGQESIALFTPKERHQLVLDDGKNEVRLGDEKLESAIEIKSASGNVTIRAKNKLALEVGKVRIILDGEKGSIRIEGAKLEAEADSVVEISSNGRLSISGVTGKLAASSSLQLESGGVVTTKGKMIKTGG